MMPVPISPLQLNQHYFARIHLQAIPAGKKDAPTTLNREVAFAPHPSDQKIWQVELKIFLSSEDKANPFLYDIDIHVLGFFELLINLPPDQGKQIIVVNGLSILYGAAREMVINMTARGPFGPVSLPSMSFTDICSQTQAGAEQVSAGAEPATLAPAT